MIGPLLENAFARYGHGRRTVCESTYRVAWTVLRKFLPAALRSTDGREAERVFHDCILAVWCGVRWAKGGRVLTSCELARR